MRIDNGRDPVARNFTSSEQIQRSRPRYLRVQHDD
jgi:hypothetical protein